jgi:hypothetical protein
MKPAQAYDRVIYPREIDRLCGDPAFSVRIVADAAIGIEVGGLVIVKTPQEWHRLATADSATDDRFDRPIVRLNNYP